LRPISYNSTVEEGSFLKALLKIVYLEEPIPLEEALSTLERELNVTRLEVLARYLKSKEEGLLSAQLDENLKLCLWLTPKGLRRLQESAQRLQAETSMAVPGGEVVYE
jgi:energy-converting hydrogenase A subunit M